MMRTDIHPLPVGFRRSRRHVSTVALALYKKLRSAVIAVVCLIRLSRNRAWRQAWYRWRDFRVSYIAASIRLGKGYSDFGSHFYQSQKLGSYKTVHPAFT